MKKLRLGFYFHVPATISDGGIYMPGFQGRFIDSLASYCEQVTCFLHSPVAEDLKLIDYCITSPNVNLVNIGAHASVLRRIMTANKYTGPLRSYQDNLDCILLRGPSPLLPAMAIASPVPTTLLLVGDYTTGTNDLPQPSWRKRIIHFWSLWNKWRQKQIARRSLTFVNSRVLYDELKGRCKYLYETRTTTLTSDDFFLRPDTCQSSPFHLLYIGRMDRAKGLLQMVEAVALLTARGENVILDLVGWPTPKDPILEEIQVLALSKNISEKVKYHGSRPLGPELFSFYRKSDIFVTASLASEGFPRTILEAMAHSLPVVATRVGSISAYVEDAAVLVPPKDVDALTNAIFNLIHESNLRHQIIQKGIEIAQNNTLEVQTAKMISVIQKWVGEII